MQGSNDTVRHRCLRTDLRCSARHSGICQVRSHNAAARYGVVRGVGGLCRARSPTSSGHAAATIGRRTRVRAPIALDKNSANRRSVQCNAEPVSFCLAIRRWRTILSMTSVSGYAQTLVRGMQETDDVLFPQQATVECVSHGVQRMPPVLRDEAGVIRRRSSGRVDPAWQIVLEKPFPNFLDEFSLFSGRTHVTSPRK